MNRHRLDVFSLLAGLFFTTVAVLALTGGWSFSVGPWLWPSVLIGAGVVVLLALLAAARDRDDDPEDPTTPTGPTAEEELPAHHRSDDPVMAAARAEAEAADPFAADTADPTEEGTGGAAG